MNKKRLLLVLIALFTINATTVLGATFSDIEGHWAENVIEEMAKEGILNGFDDGTFRPDENVTREQYAKILVETFNIEEVDDLDFKDIEDDRWSKDYIAKAHNYMSVYKHDGEWYFRPERKSIREDVASSLIDVLNLSQETIDYSLINQFSDSGEITYTMQDSVALAVEYGLMKGKGEIFDPQGYLTRAELCQIIYNWQNRDFDSVLIKQYKWVNDKKTVIENGFIEIKIGPEDFASYQDDSLIVTPTPDSIQEDEFGNKYIRYDVHGLEPGAEFNVVVKRKINNTSETKKESKKDLAIYLEPQERIESKSLKIILNAQAVTDGLYTDYDKAEAIFKYVNVNMEHSDDYRYANEGAYSAIQSDKGTSEESATLFVAMCRAVGIPARAINAYEAAEDELTLYLLAEVYIEDRGWLPVYTHIHYIIDGQREPYMQGFDTKDDSYVITDIYNYSKFDRRYTNVAEAAYSVKLIKDNMMYYGE